MTPDSPLDGDHLDFENDPDLAWLKDGYKCTGMVEDSDFEDEVPQD